MRLSHFFGAALLVASPVMAQEAGTTTANQIEPQAYAGVWYEIARTPAPYEQDCVGGVTATYTLLDDTTIEVNNRCDRASGDPQGTIGQAEVVDGNFNTYAVQFDEQGGAPGINYRVAAVGEEQDGRYPWAAVHSPNGDIGWILSRQPELSVEARQKAEAALEEAGVDLSALSDTAQPPETYEPSTD